MGMPGPVSRSSYSQTTIKPSIPNPSAFIILSTTQIGKYVVVEIRYPGCTNFDGEKICVFENTTVDKIRSLSKLDPHFAESGLTPIARFIPTEEGYNRAVKFCKMESIYE